MKAMNLRKGLLGLTGALGAFGLQACTTPQPAPECTMPTTSSNSLVPPLAVLLTQTNSATGDCADLTTMQVGVQRFRTAPQGGDFKLGVKPSVLIDPYLGFVYTGDDDVTNDCSEGVDCQGEVKLENACVVINGGTITLADGTPVAADGTVTPAAGEPYKVKVDNECMVTEEEVYRDIEGDPDALSTILIGDMPQFPTDGICTVTNFTSGLEGGQPGVVTYAPYELGDGSTLPATTYTVAFSDFKVIDSTKATGTAFTAKMTFSIDTCSAEYEMKGFWSGAFYGDAFIPCSPDSAGEKYQYAPECDPSPNPDAGTVFGSGISPELKPMCDKDLEVCVPTVDFATLTE